jgi:hypothetical protein
MTASLPVLARPADVPALPDEVERRRFPSLEARNAAIVALALQGVPPRQIEQQIFASVGTIYVVLTAARKRGIAVPLFKKAADPAPAGTPRLVQVDIPRRCVAALARHAEARGISPFALARRIVEVVADVDLVDAVLDDGERGA